MPNWMGVIQYVDKYRGSIEEIPKNVETKAKFDTSEAERHLTVYKAKLAALGMAGGGIAGYMSGGVIGHDGFMQPLLSASSGLITPSFDNGGILSILHKNEVVLNSKQTRNLAELIFGLANTPQNIEGTGTGGQPINITNNIELDGEVIYQKTSKYLYDNQRSKQIGMGMR